MSMVENLDKTFPNVHNWNEHYKWQAKEGALLLYQAGEATQEIFETLPETEEDYATAQPNWMSIFPQEKC